MGHLLLVPLFMTKTIDFDQPLTNGDIDGLYRDGKIPRAGVQFLKQLTDPRTLWGNWADRLSLVVGTVLVLAGVIFFFAFNWKDMAGWQKLGLVNLGLIVCIVGAVVRGLDRVAGQALAIAASFLVGAFMAVFGQIYQTGADAYQLFMMWSILILPWVLMSKSLAHWTLWLIVFNLYLVTVWVQTVGDGIEVQVALALVGLLAFGLQSQFARTKPKSWLNHNWFSWIWLLYGLMHSAFLVGFWAFKLRYGFDFDGDPFDGQYHHLAGIVGLLLHLVAYYLVFQYFRNMVSAQIWTLISAILVSAIFLIFFAETVFDAGEVGLLFGGLFMAGVVVGIFWGGIKFLNAHQFASHSDVGGYVDA